MENKKWKTKGWKTMERVYLFWKTKKWKTKNGKQLTLLVYK